MAFCNSNLQILKSVMTQLNKLIYREKWQLAWQSRPFRRQTISGVITLIAVFIFLPFFFQAIEKRNGTVLNDWVLALLPPHNVSLFIFISIWVVTILIFIRMAQSPDIFIVFLWAYVLLCILRIATISMVALNAPKGLIELADPVSNFFYGHSFVTKDLFYSGHASSVFLIFYCLKKKSDKTVGLIGALIVSSLLLIQHVHYSIDVVAAPLFAYFCYMFSKKMIYDYSY